MEPVTQLQMERIFEVTDALGIHRERVLVPLAPRHPGRVRMTPAGRLEIAVESEGFDAWAATLEEQIRRAAGHDLGALSPGARPGPGGTPRGPRG